MANSTLKNFLQENLSWVDYEQLKEHLGMHPRGLTYLLEDPSKGNKLQKEKIASLLQKWNEKYDADFLTAEFGFGLKEEVTS